MARSTVRSPVTATDVAGHPRVRRALAAVQAPAPPLPKRRSGVRLGGVVIGSKRRR